MGHRPQFSPRPAGISTTVVSEPSSITVGMPRLDAPIGGPLTSRKKVTVRLRPTDDEAVQRAAAVLFDGNAARFLERAVIELAYEQGIQARPEGWRKPVPVPRTERLSTPADVERALKNTLRFQAAFGALLMPPGRRGTTYHVNRQTYADLLIALRIFPAVPPPLLPAPQQPTRQSGSDDFKVTFTLSPEDYVVTLELAARMFPSTDRRASSAAGAGAGANMTSLVSLAVRTKVDALGMRTPDIAEQLVQFPLPVVAGRYIQEHVMVLLAAYRATATTLRDRSWALPPLLTTDVVAAASDFATRLLAIRLA